ncbi:hypothetical protein BXZ70DRAFT_360100 [Cristinia sonorae]|uniref:MYND-type domain-containing protein n=1 Tax=Cristinia sonorae TaxID=1940300 RepID=A0A8K0ULF6_9AGAR|nr:hypothetical protein BXZ70DRAFT_360100 [Cristinia sonorae]
MSCPWELRRLKSLDSDLLPPATSFGRLTNFNGLTAVIPTFQDWSQIIYHEPERVPLWIYYFHRKCMTAEIYTLIRAMIGTPNRMEWREHAKGHLPCVLMNLICEEGMFADDVKEVPFRAEFPYKGVLYSIDLVLLFTDSLTKIIAASGLTASGFRLPCFKDVARRMTEYCTTIWNHRQYIQAPIYSNPPNRAEATSSMRISLLTTIPTLVKIRTDMGLPTTRSSHAAHLLLYCWIYDNSPADFGALPCFEFILRESDPEMSGETFVTQAIGSCPEGYATDIAAKFSSLLWDENHKNDNIGTLISACSGIVGPKTDLFSELNFQPRTGLITGIVAACQRYMCTSSPATVRTFLPIAVTVLVAVLKDKNISERKQLPGAMNLVAIVSHALTAAVRDNNRALYRTTETLLGVQTQIVTATLSQKSRRGTAIIQNSARVWHDTLAKLRSTKPKGVAHTALQREAVTTWIRYGSVLGLKEGVDVQTLSGPSIPHDGPWFGMEQRCFYKPCVCSGCHPPHHMRICKGCWRVLYCSKLCQASDWAAGHRKLCQPLNRK